jgi:hypothetical protein
MHHCKAQKTSYGLPDCQFTNKFVMYNFQRMLAAKMARMTWLWIRGELLPCLQNSVPDDDLPCGLSTDCVDMGSPRTKFRSALN